jgi:hypothetical protein
MSAHPSLILQAAAEGRLSYVLEHLPTVEELGLSQEMVEAAAMIAAASDGECIEPTFPRFPRVLRP